MLNQSFRLKSGFVLGLGIFGIAFFSQAQSYAQVNFQAVVTEATLPSKSSEFAKDFTGDSTPENKMGQMLGLMNGIYKMQADVDRAIQNGTLNIVIELKSDANAQTLHLYQGIPQGGNAYAIDSDPSTPQNISLPVTVASTEVMAGPGAAQVPNAFLDRVLYFQIKQATVTAEIDDTTQQISGQINGAMDKTVVETELLPNLADRITYACNNEGGNAFLCMTLDSDGDGAVTASELLTNWYVKAMGLLDYDVDVDGDGVNESMSMGFGFTAKACTIVP